MTKNEMMNMIDAGAYMVRNFELDNDGEVDYKTVKRGALPTWDASKVALWVSTHFEDITSMARENREGRNRHTVQANRQQTNGRTKVTQFYFSI